MYGSRLYVYSRNLCPRLHVYAICNKGLNMSGIIKRVAFGFYFCYIYMYCSLILSILEYGSIMWEAHTSYTILGLKKVPRKFFGSAKYILNTNYVTYSVMLLSHDRLGISSLIDRIELI